MKKITTIILFSLLSNILNAQIPSGYYDPTLGLTGAALKTKLSSIITNGHKDMGYGSGTGGLWTAYYTTDVDNYYEKDGTVLDMYSENPAPNTPGFQMMPININLGKYQQEVTNVVMVKTMKTVVITENTLYQKVILAGKMLHQWQMTPTL